MNNLRPDDMNLGSNSGYVPRLIRPILGLINDESNHTSEYYSIHFMPGFLHLMGDGINHHICNWDGVKCWSYRPGSIKEVYTRYYRYINLNRNEVLNYIDYSLDHKSDNYLPTSSMYRILVYILEYTYHSGLMERLGDSRYNHYIYRVVIPSSMELIEIINSIN